MKWKGPAALFSAWLLHDVEEATTFPATCERLAAQTGIQQLRMTPRQSWIAVGLMGLLAAAACARGVAESGDSRFYRAVAAGLEARVGTHLLASILQRGYTAGVVSAVLAMLPGTVIARRELARCGLDISVRDTAAGIAILVPAAAACHVLARFADSRT